MAYPFSPSTERHRLVTQLNRKVAELEARDWAAISESNAFCYGMRVIREKVPSTDAAAGETPSTTAAAAGAPSTAVPAEQGATKPAEKAKGERVGVERARYPGKQHSSSFSLLTTCCIP